jgi:histidyl-tRNA synthetase
MDFVNAERADGAATCARLRELIGSSEQGREGVEELETMAEILESQGYRAPLVKIDPSIVRGLGYYTGPVYEAELTFEIIDDKGEKRQFGSVAGGGRYDDLVGRFTGQRTPGTGVSIGVDRLYAALSARRKPNEDKAQGPVVILASERDRMVEYQSLCTELRNAGIRAEVYMGGGTNMGKQLKYADKRAAPVAVIIGSEERERGVVQIKDLVLGARLASEIESNEEWKAQPAQREVARGEALATIRQMLES